MNNLLQELKLIKEAKEIPVEIIEKLPSSKRYQFKRVRDDIDD